MDGEDYALDSGCHHAAHAAACMGIVLDALATGNLIDDRPTRGAASALIDQLTTEGDYVLGHTAKGDISYTPTPVATPNNPTTSPNTDYVTHVVWPNNYRSYARTSCVPPASPVPSKVK